MFKHQTQLIATFAVTLLLSNGAAAIPANPGTPVTKIPFASQIKDWELVNKSTIIVSTDRSYVLNLREACHELGFSETLGFSASNNTIYAGFDYVTVGNQRCAIQSINHITPKQRALLTSF